MHVHGICLPTCIVLAVLKKACSGPTKDVLKDDHRAALVSIHIPIAVHGMGKQHQHPSLPLNRGTMQTPEGRAKCSRLLQYMWEQQPNTWIHVGYVMYVTVLVL